MHLNYEIIIIKKNLILCNLELQAVTLEYQTFGIGQEKNKCDLNPLLLPFHSVSMIPWADPFD